MFSDLTYEEMDEIVHEIIDKDANLYDLYLAISREQTRRLVVRAKIREALHKRGKR